MRAGYDAGHATYGQYVVLEPRVPLSGRPGRIAPVHFKGGAMDDTIYLLDFRNGTVEPVDATVPPPNVADPTDPARLERQGVPSRVGYVLAALGSPPASDKE